MARKPKILSRKKVRAALEAAHGIRDRAARVLKIPRTTLQAWLSGPLRDLEAYIDELRAQYAPDGRGRPWVVDDARTRDAVRAHGRLPATGSPSPPVRSKSPEHLSATCFTAMDCRTFQLSGERPTSEVRAFNRCDAFSYASRAGECGVVACPVRLRSKPRESLMSRRECRKNGHIHVPGRPDCDLCVGFRVA